MLQGRAVAEGDPTPVDHPSPLTAGNWDLEVKYTPDRSQLPPGVELPSSIDPNGPSLFTALEEQLGLKLRPARGPVEVLVIDSVQQPTPN